MAVETIHIDNADDILEPFKRIMLNALGDAQIGGTGWVRIEHNEAGMVVLQVVHPSMVMDFSPRRDDPSDETETP